MAVKDAVVERSQCFRINYGDVLEKEISKLELAIADSEGLGIKRNNRWLAIKLLEEDTEVLAEFEKTDAGKKILALKAESYAYLSDRYG